MTDAELIEKLEARGIAGAAQPGHLLAALDGLGRAGCVTLVKVDGLRSTNIYTVLVSGGPLLPDAGFRKDGNDLAALLREAITFFLENSK